MHFYKKNAKKNFLLYEKIINHSPLQRHTLTSENPLLTSNKFFSTTHPTLSWRVREGFNHSPLQRHTLTNVREPSPYE